MAAKPASEATWREVVKHYRNGNGERFAKTTGYECYADVAAKSDTPRRAGGLMSGAASKAVTRVYNC